jgi:hypothetical protein
MITDREREEKEAKLTARTRACSEEPKENRSGLIPPGTREKKRGRSRSSSRSRLDSITGGVQLDEAELHVSSVRQLEV